MSLLPPSRIGRQEAAPDPARSLDQLATVVMTVIVVAILYFAREVLVPIAIALIFSFVLSPPIRLLRRIGVGRKTSIGLVMLLGFVLACGVGTIAARQISGLAEHAPEYQATIAKKVSGLESYARNSPILAKMNDVLAKVAGKAEHNARAAAPAPTKSALFPSPVEKKAQDTANAGKGPLAVEVVQPPPGVLTVLEGAAGSVAKPVATAVFVAVFIVFMLLQREDLRNRFIRLMGSRDIQRTTMALTDAARRLSRYFLAQVLVNTAFGIFVGGVMLVLGVPGAVLCGFATILLRFIPYVGSLASALLPIALSAAAEPGWALAVETAALYTVSEFITGQILEPLVYGHNTGISPIAVIASATFWTWLWGPIGLVLATPLTVCFVVLGRHVDRLGFIEVLLGDTPPLTEAERFYQRMLAGDPSEVVDQAERFLAEHSLLEYCDRVAMPALFLAQADVRGGVLDEARQQRILDTVREVADDLADTGGPDTPAEAKSSAPAALDEEEPEAETHPDADTTLPRVAIDPAWGADGAVVCVAGRSPLDEAAACLLADIFKAHGLGARVEPPDRLAQRQAGGSVDAATRLILLSFFDADIGLAQARFAVRRLRRQAPGVPIVPAFWLPGEAQNEGGDGGEAELRKLVDGVRCETGAGDLPAALRLALDKAAVGEDAPVAESTGGDTRAALAASP